MSGCGGSDGKNSGGTGWVEIDVQKVKKVCMFGGECASWRSRVRGQL